MRILRAGDVDVRKLIPIRKSIELARHAYLQRARKEVIEPLRSWLTAPGGSSFYFMPAHVRGSGMVSIKVVSVNPKNRALSLPSTSATIHVFDSKNGQELAQIAADELTPIRTAASSALATDLLAPKKADSLGIIGTGKQAEAHLYAILSVRNASRVQVYSRSRAHRKAFVRKASKVNDLTIGQATSPEQVAHDSDVLVLATSSNRPLFKGKVVQPGTHVNAVGASLPESREMDTALVKRSILVVDSREQALSTYGEVLIPLREKAIRRNHIKAELGELLLDPNMIRRTTNDITIFKAGGLAALDAAFANHVVSKLEK